MIRRFYLVAGYVFACVATASGQFQIGPQLGLDLSDSDFFIGANAVFKLPWEMNYQPLSGNPEFYFYLLGDGPNYSESLTVIALNALYPLSLDFANAYVGAGVMLAMYSADYNAPLPSGRQNFDDTDFGFIAKFGVDFAGSDANVIPWVEAGLHIVDGGGFWAQGGARFAL